MNAWTAVLAAAVVTDRIAGRNCRRWKNPARQSAATCDDSDSWLSSTPPRSRADSETQTCIDNIVPQHCDVQLADELDHVIKWSESNKLKLNLEKDKGDCF